MWREGGRERERERERYGDRGRKLRESEREDCREGGREGGRKRRKKGEGSDAIRLSSQYILRLLLFGVHYITDIYHSPTWFPSSLSPSTIIELLFVVPLQPLNNTPHHMYY